MALALDAKRETFLWACGWTFNERSQNWESPKGTERHHCTLDVAVREQFQRCEEVLLDMAAGHAWDWAAKYQELKGQYVSLREQTMELCARAAALAAKSWLL